MSPQEAIVRICAVVITYRPDKSLLENLSALRQQIRAVYVVDNTPEHESNNCLSVAEQRAFVVIRNRRNLGIATALNIGIRRAIEDGFMWVATFDQDSAITPGYFESMFAAYEKCPFRDQVPLIAPELCYSEADCERKRGQNYGPLYTLTRTAMTSGSLIRTDIFAREGFYDESFFMDYVDYEFCLRLWKRGWRIIRATEAHLLHRLGLPETHTFLGFKVSIKSHNSWRRYYIMRNRVIVFRRYGFSSPAWCFHDFCWIFLELTKIVLFEKDKGRQLRATVRGIWHGLIGNTSASP